MIGLLVCTLLVIICVVLRIAPIWRVRHQGCDSYYFLLTAEAFKEQKRIPVRLPGYFLAESPVQTYPPGFTVLLGLLPKNWLHNYHWAISPILDAANLAVLFWFIHANFGFAPAVVAASLYLFIPDLQTESMSLTSRSLGNLLLSGYMVGLLQFYAGGNLRWLLLSLVVGSVILMTHKLTTQLLLVLSVGLSLLTLQAWPILVFVAAIVLTFLIFRRVYVLVLKGHYDVVSFWHKHIARRGEHIVYDSPIYANAEKSRRGRAIFSLPRGQLARHLIGCNPLLLALPALFPLAAAQSVTWILWCWGALTLLTALATLFVPVLRQFGQGHRYAKMSAFPLAALCTLALTTPVGVWMKIVLFVIVAVAVAKTLRNAYTTFSAAHCPASVVDDDMRKAFDYIKERDLDYFFCLDVHPSEALAYYCRKHVLWGNHHLGLNTMLVEFIPTLTKPLEYFVETYGIRYLFLDKKYVAPEDLRLGAERLVWHGGRYAIYDVQNNFGKTEIEVTQLKKCKTGC